MLDIYTAATVLLAARLRPVIAESVPGHSVADSWAHAIEILKSFARLGQSAQRCVAALEILSAKIPLDSSPPNTQQDGNSLNQSDETMANSSMPVKDLTLDDLQTGVDFDDIVFDLNDMSWLTSLPGNL